MSVHTDKLVANENGFIPYMQLVVAVQGLEALNRGMRLTRMATPQRCMEIISQLTGVQYKRTHRNRALVDGKRLLEQAKAQMERSKQDANS